MNEELAHHIAANLIRIRTDRGLSQRALARAVGCSCAAVANWEAPSVSISAEHLVAVAMALDVPVAELLGEDSSEAFRAGYGVGWAACRVAVENAARDAPVGGDQ